MPHDFTLALIVYAIACIVAPWLFCRSLPPVENSSRAVRRYLDKRAAHSLPDADSPHPSRGGSSRAFNGE